MTGFAAKHNQNPLGDAATVAQADYVIAGSSSLSLEAAEALKRSLESESTGGVTVVFRANNLSKTNPHQAAESFHDRLGDNRRYAALRA